MNNPRLPDLREKTKKLPLDPGVYIMRDKNGEIIYIGKAKALRNRVGSYFRSVDKHLPKVYRMVENVVDFDYIVTKSEFEALVLECSMIKLHKPKYNILLKDDKGYHYIRISNEPYPRVTAEKQRPPDDGALYMGPYPSAYAVNQTVEEVHLIFRLPTCKKRFPEDFRKGRPCLNYHIKRCMGVCTGRIKQRDYGEIVEQIKEFVGSGSKKTMEHLTARMEEAAEALDFEKAAQLRDRIKGLQHVTERQSVVFARVPDQDVVAVSRNGEESFAVVLKFRDQRLVDKQNFPLGQIDSLAPARRDFLLRFYGNLPQGEIPRQISLDGECEEEELVERFLSERAGRRVALHRPARGEQLRLVEMAAANAAEQLSHKVERTGREVAALDELARLLGMEKPPVYIESFDISNLGSETVVAGMVVFENGRPLKSAYRKFNIKTVEGTDDYASMREVVRRRLSHYEEERESGKGFGRLPDLILLDGGKGHVSAVQPVLEEMGFAIPLFGMVKDDRHRTRAIAQNGGEISIASTRSAFTLVSRIQDEVHRFSIAHMKNRHRKNAFELKLTSVEGIGPARAQNLFRHFKTQTAMRAATREELAAAPGMNSRAAQALYQFFHGEEENAGESRE